MTTYTNITKPSGTSYTNQNTIGKEQFDDVNVVYDDSGVFFDGINYSQYTSVSKPGIGDGLWSSAVYPWELALPWSVSVPNYTKITKPI